MKIGKLSKNNAIGPSRYYVSQKELLWKPQLETVKIGIFGKLSSRCFQIKSKHLQQLPSLRMVSWSMTLKL